MTKIDLNKTPYFDDYSESKKFYKILFRPGRSVQARELTQIQSIIQNQIGRFGKHFFKSLALVSPRPSLGCKYDPTTVFVKISTSASSRTETENNLKTHWLNKRVKSQLNVQGIVIGYHKSDDWVRLFITLEKAGTGDTGITANNFRKGDTVSVDVVDVLPDGTSSVTTTLSAEIHTTTNAVGRIASVEIPDSIYFYNDYFVSVDTQKLFIMPDDVDDDLAWNATPTCDVGIEMLESIVSFEDDSTLLDNASGASNYAAPGADRLKIEGVLKAKQLNSIEQNFIKILTVQKGIITKAWQLETDPYNDPYKAILAKRTFDESGNYTVKPFIVESRPFLSTSNLGLFTEEALSIPFSDDELSILDAKEAAIKIAKEVFELTWGDQEDPKVVQHNGRYYPGTSYNDTNDSTSFVTLCDDRLGLRFQPGSAYVEGYFQEKPVITNVSIKKSRTSDFLPNKTIQTPKGTNLLITNVVGFPPISDPGNSNLSYEQIELHSIVLTSRDAQPSASTKIGTARVYSIGLHLGSNGSYNAVYSLGVFDVKFDDGYEATDVASIYYPSGAFSGSFCANMVFKDASTQPSLRFTGTINKYQRETATNVPVTNTETTSELELTFNTEAERDAKFVDHYTVGTVLSITKGANTTERTITSVSKDENSGDYLIVVGLNEPLPTPTYATPLSSVSTIRKVKGIGTLWKTNAGEKLEKGDQVAIGTGDNRRIYTVYSNPSNDNELSLNPDPTISSNSPWENGSVMTYLVAEAIQDSSLGNAGLVYRLPHSDTRSLRGGNRNAPNYDSFTTTYVATRYAIAGGSGANQNTAVSSGGVTYTLGQNEDFERGLSNYSLVHLETGNWFQLFPYSGQDSNGDDRDLYVGSISNEDYKAEVVFNTGQITFKVNIQNPSSASFGLIVAVEKSLSAATERKKTLVKGTFNENGIYTGPVKEVTDADSKKISLGVPDVFRITRVVESPDITTPASSSSSLPLGHNDITFKYLLDDGQRDYYYGTSEVFLRPGYDKPKGRLRIEFDYFEHSGTGDYFSVDSYPWNQSTTTTNSPQINYDEIPEYSSAKYGKFDLKACLDFRPVCLPGTQATQNGKLKFVAHKELPTQDVVLSYHVYEERRDKIYIDKNGLIKVKYGVPSIIAEVPQDPIDGMVLYDVQMLPYTENYTKCILKMRDNRRYTMRDIGKLEKRVKTLEYYTSLSLLEKDTNDLIIKDSLGQDKFKHGFMVDNFRSEALYDTQHPDSTAAIDKLSGELKPRIFVNHVNLIEKWNLPSRLAASEYNNIQTAREANNYERTGSLFTLSYQNVSYMEQQLASRLINVNPYNVASFSGMLKITPWSDTWRDTVVSEPLIVYDTTAYDFARKQFNDNGERTDWHGTKTDWQSLDTESVRNIESVVTASHQWPSPDGRYISAKTGQLIKPKNGQMVIVPPGFKNSGEAVPYRKSGGQGQETYTNTTTQRGEQYSTGIKSNIVDTGFSNPVSLGSRIIDSKAADHIRTNEIKFVGKCFLPNSKLYAFFDGVDVSRYCIPDVDFGGRLETPDAIRRGPYTSLSCEFKNSTISIKGDKSSVSDQHKLSDGSTTPPGGNPRERTLAGYDYDTIISYAPAADYSPDLDSTTKLTGTVKLLVNNTAGTVDGVPAGEYYVTGTGTKFLTELVGPVDNVTTTTTQQKSVLVISGLDGEYQIKKIISDTLALITPPYTNSSGVYTMLSSESARPCVDLLEVLQKLYISKYLDTAVSSGLSDTKFNITNKLIKSVDYIPATPSNSSSELKLILEDNIDFGETTETKTVGIKIKNRSTDKDLTQPTNQIELKCDSTGTVKGKFVIPDPRVSGNPRFKTGERVFRLTNSEKNEVRPEVSKADAKYTASGWIDVKQDQQYSTKQFRIDQQYVEGERTPISLSDTFESYGKVCPRDPLAQSFIVSEATGIFLTAIDVFFYSKDSSLPIILQIRPLDDGGNPSNKLIYETTLDAEDVVVNKIDLTKQTLTVVGNPEGVVGFNKGPWDPAATTNTGINKVLSANQSSGKNVAPIQDGVAFTYTSINGEASPYNDMIPTRFVFDYPIYLPGNNTSYCFVLLTDSTQPIGSGIEALENTYQVYMAQKGAAPVTNRNNVLNATPIHLLEPLDDNEDDINYILGTRTQVSRVNSDGVLFKSINGLSWESDQNADLKYQLFRASFNNTRNAEIEFVNERLPLKSLIFDPFETSEGKSQVRVFHENHNIPEEGRVVFFGLPQGVSLNGIPYQVLARPEGHIISTPTLDSYIIDLSDDNIVADTSGKIGGKTVLATSEIRFEEFLLRTNPIVLQDTSISWRFSGITAQAAYDPESVPWEIIPELNFSANSDVILPKSALISSAINEKQKLTDDDAFGPGVATSVKIIASLNSRSEYVSPVLDQERIAIDTKGVILDNPVGTGAESNNINKDDFDTLICLPTEDLPAVDTDSLNGKIYFSDTDNKLTGSNFFYEGKKVRGVGTLFSSELKIGDTIKHPMLDSTRKVLEIVSDTEMYISEEFPLSDLPGGGDDGGGTTTLLYNPPFLKLKTADANLAVHLSALDVGKYLSVSGTQGALRDFENKKILAVNYTPNSTLVDAELTAAHNDGNKTCKCEIVVEHRLNEDASPGLESWTSSSSSFKIKQLNNFVDEIAPMGGSVSSKYVPKTMKLTNPANTLKIMFDGCRPKHSHIDLYYKVGTQSDENTFDSKNWTKLDYTIETNGVLETLTPQNNSTLLSFSAYEANALQLDPFTLVKVKVVLRGGHTVLYPKIKNLRIIALEE